MLRSQRIWPKGKENSSGMVQSDVNLTMHIPESGNPPLTGNIHLSGRSHLYKCMEFVLKVALSTIWFFLVLQSTIFGNPLLNDIDVYLLILAWTFLTSIARRCVRHFFARHSTCEMRLLLLSTCHVTNCFPLPFTLYITLPKISCLPRHDGETRGKCHFSTIIFAS